jgi:hypothetical protein
MVEEVHWLELMRVSILFLVNDMVLVVAVLPRLGTIYSISIIMVAARHAGIHMD